MVLLIIILEKLVKTQTVPGISTHLENQRPIPDDLKDPF